MAKQAANSAPTYKSATGAVLNVEQWPIDRVLPYDKNPRAINDKAITKVAASISEFGFQQPIVVDKAGVIIVGHTRRKAAEKLGLATVPVVIADLPEEKARAYRLADNRTAQETDWLDDVLKEELTALAGLDFDLALTGFDERELDKLLADDAELARAEETPAIPENPVSVAGDVWILGKHRLVCGSSTVATDVEKALNGVKPHLMVTDPPYGVEYDPTWRDGVGEFGDGKTKMRGKVANDDKADWNTAWALFPGSVAYVWSAPGPLQVVSYQSLVDSGFEPRYQIIWRKSHFVMGRGDYHWQHEPCWYAVRKGSKASWNGDRTQTSVWDIKGMNPAGRNRDKGNEKTSHGTQKPVECMLRPIKNNSSEGQAVYEPFSGSGTTIIAGEMSGRCVHAIELNPAYVDVAVIRWQDFASAEAVLEGDGRTFAQVKESRQSSA